MTVSAREGELRLDGVITGGTSFAAVLMVETDGRMTAEGDSLKVENATCIRAVICMGTSVRGIEEELEASRFAPSEYERKKAAHTARFTELMGRMTLTL